MSSIFGLDYVSGPPIADMKAASVAFVCRYLSEVNPQTAVKLLSLEEAKALSQAGIALISNYEWYKERSLEGEVAGMADAKIAASQHTSCGGPPDRPIYFSVDIDVAGEQVAEYFKGVALVIGKERTGAYGSYRVLQYLFDQRLISWGWQTYAWSGTPTQWEPRAHIQQYQDSAVMSGHSVDYNRALSEDFGQWFVGGMSSSMIPQGWHDDGKTLTAPNGVPVVLGFRKRVLAGWDPNDWPVGPQYHTNQLELSNPDLGPGDQQIFRKSLLGYPDSPTGAVAHLKGQVVDEYVGQELYACRQQAQSIYTAYQQLQKEQASSSSSSTLSVVQQIKTLVAPF